MSENIVPHKHTVTSADRKAQYSHAPKLLWFTGLSGSGKSTLANALESYLFQKGVKTYLLDGDNIRSGLNKDLDFSLEGRQENIRRISEVSNLFVDAGLVVLSAFISPLREDRAMAKTLVGPDNFIEIFVECPLEVCEERDVKGLYAKARAGLIKDFTGISSPFETPVDPDVIVNTANNSLEMCLQELKEVIVPRIRLKESEL